VPGVTNSCCSSPRLLSGCLRIGSRNGGQSFLFLLSFPVLFPWCVLSFWGQTPSGDRPRWMAKGS